MSLFAANSLLCRLALTQTSMDAPSFTMVRIVSGAAMLWCLLFLKNKPQRGGSFAAASALFGYMLSFSLGYLEVDTAPGTLIFVCSILLITIILARIAKEPVGKRQLAGGAVSLAGLSVLLGPSLSRPPVVGAALMGCAGAAWALYSFLGRKSTAPTLDTAGNFIRCLPFAALLLPFMKEMPPEGLAYAVASGALASGLGYILWYRLNSLMGGTTAAFVQLSIPVLTAVGAWLFLGESITIRLVLSGCIILCGIAFARIHSIKR